MHKIMEIAKECPEGLADIMRELHKVQLDEAESGVTCSVDVSHTDYPYTTIYIHDPKPRKGRKQLDSFWFYPPCEWSDYVKENRKAYTAMLKYYDRMKSKAAQ